MLLLIIHVAFFAFIFTERHNHCCFHVNVLLHVVMSLLSFLGCSGCFPTFPNFVPDTHCTQNAANVPGGCTHYSSFCGNTTVAPFTNMD